MPNWDHILGERICPEENTPKWIARMAARQCLWDIHDYLASRERIFLEDNSASKYEIIVRIRWLDLEEIKELKRPDPLLAEVNNAAD